MTIQASKFSRAMLSLLPSIFGVGSLWLLNAIYASANLWLFIAMVPACALLFCMILAGVLESVTIELDETGVRKRKLFSKKGFFSLQELKWNEACEVKLHPYAIAVSDSQQIFRIGLAGFDSNGEAVKYLHAKLSHLPVERKRPGQRA